MKLSKVIILLGPPGAGKGTQAELLSDKLSFYYFETSKILEREFQAGSAKKVKIEGKEYSPLEEKKLWGKGVLCSPPFVTYLVKKKIKELAESGESLVLAGSPRTLYEGERVIPFLKKLYGSIKVLLIEISPKETIFRNSHRRICQLMRHPVLYNKETIKLTLCPLDGSKLVRRKGLDDPGSLETRLNEYKERTFPLVEYFRKEGLNVEKINGEQSVADVFKDILKAIK